MIKKILIKVRSLVFSLHSQNKPEPHSVVGGVDIDKLSQEASEYLKTFYIEVVKKYCEIDTDYLIARCKTLEQIKYAERILGEHYRILTAIAQAGKVKKVVEIGSATGMSAIQLRHYGLKVTCFDIFEWDSIENSLLTVSDFSDGNLEWIVEDLSNYTAFETYTNLLENADLIFIDAPKDGIFEYCLIPKLMKLQYNNPFAMLVIDDINFHNMKDLWHSIGPGRIDFTFLGHVSGTGVVFPKFCVTLS